MVENKEYREQLMEVSWGAEGQLQTVSHFVFILARTDARYDSECVLQLQKHIKHIPDDLIKKMRAAYQSFQEDKKQFESDRALFDWASKQTYIALGNMMTAAAQIGIGSCPIEGFSSDKGNELFEKKGLLEDGRIAVSVMVAFGYRAENPERPKTRRAVEEVVQWIN